MSVFAQFAANQLGTAQHIAPLVITAKLQIAAIFLEHVVEVVALHNHVVEFQKAQAFFHTLFVAFCTQHVVDREAMPYFTEQFNII